MPRAFLIKAKKDKKKDDELPNQPVQEIDEFSNATQVPLSNRVVTNSEAGCRVSSSPQTQSSPKSLPTKRKLSQDGCEGGDVVFSYPAERSYKTVKSTLFNDGISSKKGSVVVSRLPSHKKTRKRSPKKTVVYYYKVKKEDGSDAEFDNRQAPWQETAALQTVPRHEQAAFRKTSSNYSAECKDVNSPGNLAGGVHYAQRAQSKGGEKSSRFEYQNNAPHGNCGTSSGEYPNEPRDVPSSLQSAGKNVGLDRVKIVEIHTVGKKMDIVYSDKLGDAPKQVSENRPVEQYHCSKNPTTSLPTSVAAPHYVQREEQATAAEKPPVQVSATGTTPVVHYLPVYAIPSSSGVQYQAVPGAAILEKVPGSSNLYSPVQKSNAVSSQPAYQPQTPSTVAQQPQAQPVVSRIPQPQPHHARPQLQPHPQPPSHPQVPQQQPQGPVMYRPRMIANQANSQPSQLPVGPSAYPAQQGHHPMATLPYPPQDPRIMQPQAYPPQTVPQPVSTPSYVVTKTEPMPPQQLSPPGHPVVVSQPYIVTDQARHLLPSTHYPVQTQGLRGQPPYPPQDQKVSRVPHYPLPYEAVQTQPSYPVHIVPVAVPHAPMMAQHLPANQPAPPASSASVVTIPQQYSSTPPSQPFYPAQSSAVQYVPEKSSSVPPVHYYPAEKPAAQAVPQYQGEKPASAQSLPYPVENPNQPLTPQYTPNPTDQQQKFTYAPPPPDFMYSPVYRVPVTTATETSQPPKGAKRRKTAMPHRETRDILTPPESYMEQPSKDSMSVQGHETASKSPGQNPVLNKSSCVITPPGSPQDEQDGSYTVVMRDYGIQAGPQATQTQSSTEQGMWEVKVKEDAPRVYVSEREALADKYDDGATSCEEEDDEEEDESDPDDDDDSQYSPTQKENMSPKDDFLDDDKTVHNSSRKGWRRHMKYTCRFCHKGFQWHSHLLSHERTHTGEKPFKCSECARAFTRADGLQCHMLVHNRKRPFKCQYCSKGFNDNTTLEKHIYSHTGVKPFKCEYCGRAFSDSQSIEKHLLVHVGTKPYKCQFCVRSFNDSQMLVRHIRSHTGEKPFKCQHCQMAFSKQSALVIHTRVHTGEKPYSCPHCFKCFSISGNLQRHILIHTGERPYQCSKCPKAFNNPSHLSRHISKLHAPQAKGDPSEISNDQNVGTENGASSLVHA